MRDFNKEELAKEDAFMKGLPRFNIGAFFMPPIWGPAHGFWITILYYPAWLIADNLFFATYLEPTTMSVVLSILTAIFLLGVTIAFAIVSQPIAAHRAQDKGVSRSDYIKREKRWAVISIAIAILMVILATVYNLSIRTEV